MEIIFGNDSFFYQNPVKKFICFLSPRKVELYQVDWPGLDLGQMFVAAAPYGGPLAVVRDWKQFVKATTSGKPVIKIFTCSGNLLATISVSNFSGFHKFFDKN